MLNLKRFRDALLRDNAADAPAVPDYLGDNLANLAALAIIMLDGNCSNPAISPNIHDRVHTGEWRDYYFEGHCLSFMVTARKASDGMWIIDSLKTAEI